MKLPPFEIWYVTGSQHLYGEEALKQVAANSQTIVAELNASGALPATAGLQANPDPARGSYRADP